MRKPDEKVLRALCVLEGNPEFMVIREWFLDSSGMQDDILRRADNPQVMFQAQGAIREMLEFLELSSTPRDLAGKLAREKAGIHSIP